MMKTSQHYESHPPQNLNAQYFEDIRSIRDGKSVAPITVKGPASAVIYGAKSGRPVVINHDYIHLEGFSINGSG